MGLQHVGKESLFDVGSVLGELRAGGAEPWAVLTMQPTSLLQLAAQGLTDDLWRLQIISQPKHLRGEEQFGCSGGTGSLQTHSIPICMPILAVPIPC